LNQSPENLPKNKIMQQTVTVGMSYSGPIPPPEVLREVEKIVPGSAERLLRMAENQSAHRINQERKNLNSEIFNSIAGIISALIIGLAVLGLAAYAISKGYDWSGFSIGATGLGALVGVFVYGTKKRYERINPPQNR